MDKNITTQEAVGHLMKALNEDPDYRETWKANIAMAFKDEFSNNTFGAIQHVDEVDIHLIANNAADNFLDLLTKNEYKYMVHLPDGSSFFTATI